MYMAAHRSIQKSDNSTILRLLLEHGFDPNMDLRVEGVANSFSNLLIFAAEKGHIDQATALLDHGANVNKIMVDENILSPLTCAFSDGAHDIFRLFLARGAVPTTNDVDIVLDLCLGACKGVHPNLSRDVAIKMFATFLHLGKPDSDVVQDKVDSMPPFCSDPTMANITKHYLQGRPFCCEVCEALTAKSRDKLLVCPCRHVAYCSKECQVKHWREHKVQCKGPLNERGESEAMVKKRSKTGKGMKGGGADVGGADVGVAEGAVATGKNGKKGKKGDEAEALLGDLVDGGLLSEDYFITISNFTFYGMMLTWFFVDVYFGLSFASNLMIAFLSFFLFKVRGGLRGKNRRGKREK
jgi:hypothetical protein